MVLVPCSRGPGTLCQIWKTWLVLHFFVDLHRAAALISWKITCSSLDLLFLSRHAVDCSRSDFRAEDCLFAICFYTLEFCLSQTVEYFFFGTVEQLFLL